MGNPVFSNDIIVEESGRFTAVFDSLDGSSNMRPSELYLVSFIKPVKSVELIGIHRWKKSKTSAWKIRYRLEITSSQPDIACIQVQCHSFLRSVPASTDWRTTIWSVDFILTHPDMKTPSRGKIYSFNEANRWDWDEPLQDYATDIQQGLVRYAHITSRHLFSHFCQILNFFSKISSSFLVSPFSSIAASPLIKKIEQYEDTKNIIL